MLNSIAVCDHAPLQTTVEPARRAAALHFRSSLEHVGSHSQPKLRYTVFSINVDERGLSTCRRRPMTPCRLPLLDSAFSADSSESTKHSKANLARSSTFGFRDRDPHGVNAPSFVLPQGPTHRMLSLRFVERSLTLQGLRRSAVDPRTTFGSRSPRTNVQPGNLLARPAIRSPMLPMQDPHIEINTSAMSS